MKIIISESKINLLYNKIIDDLISKLYGELDVSEDDGYYHFNSPNKEDAPFGKNYWGMLWINDAEFAERYLKMMISAFKIDESDALDILKNYFIDKYNIKIKQASHEFWFDEDYNLI
jgi:hypothetical protein